jgi:hypothetical protein
MMKAETKRSTRDGTSVNCHYYGSTENCPVVDSRMSGRQFKSMTGQAGLTPGQQELKPQVFFILDMVSR